MSCVSVGEWKITSREQREETNIHGPEGKAVIKGSRENLFALKGHLARPGVICRELANANPKTPWNCLLIA